MTRGLGKGGLWVERDPEVTGGGESADERDVRRSHLDAWRSDGVDPFGARFAVTHHASEINQHCDEWTGQPARVAGRVMGLRRHGGVAFVDLQDVSGRVQLLLRRDACGALRFDRLLRCDLGDTIGVQGHVTRTRAGQPSLDVEDFTLLSKSLRPLPSQWYGLRDVDLRYRRRYIDLITNAEVRDLFVRRSRLVASLRETLDDRDFLEVETPVLQEVASGAAARPFITHHNALDHDFHLRISLELPLKRLLVGGLERVYEIGRVFRNEGIDTRHNPEYTLLECYQAFADYEDMMELTEALVANAARKATGATTVRWREHDIDFTPPWPRLSIIDALRARGLEVLTCTPVELRELGRSVGVELAPDLTWGQGVDALVSELVQPSLIQPTFLVDHPIDISPLARAKTDDPRLAYRFEVIVAGMELANAFTELNDPDEQRRRFQAQARERARGNDETMALDEDFVRAMEYGMPPAGGLGIGVDRLCMLLLGAASIREVVLFPTLRPE